MEEFGPTLVQGYAATKAWTPGAIMGRAEHGVSSEKETKRLSSAGRPVPGVEMRICDDGGNELPVGETGEIWIRDLNTISGYLDDLEQTKANFSEDGF